MNLFLKIIAQFTLDRMNIWSMSRSCLNGFLQVSYENNLWSDINAGKLYTVRVVYIPFLFSF